MAVDTRDKRSSAINFITVTVAPIPDGVINKSNRKQISWIYGGIVLIPLSVIQRGLLLRVYNYG